MGTEDDAEAGGEVRAARVTVPDLKLCKSRGEKIVMVTAYDAPTARLADRAGVDVVLVGDSVGTVMLGHKTVVPVTLEDILHHTRAARTGVRRALLLADLPFGTYQASVEEAVHSATRLLKEGGAQAVKLEGGAPMAATVRRLVDSGIPVMGHLGLTPQAVNLFGGHRAQGREPEAARRILEDAHALEAAGAFGIVLETVPATLAAQITQAISIPTVGIGAGPDCDGQVQVWHDLLGITSSRVFRHVKRYAEIGTLMEAALREYAEEVRQNRFPNKEHSL
jgi:3-methyl-2-oxobutanoate hydroxymethyltransferase